MTTPRLEDVLAEHGPMLARIAASYEADAARRDDLLQETSIALWRALRGFRGEASLRTFVARIANNCGIDHLAKHRRGAHDDLDAELAEVADPGPDPHTRAEHAQHLGDLLAAVRTLPLGQRQAVVMAMEGFAHAEIAAALGADENTIAVRLSRARKALHAALGAQQ